MTKKRRPTSTFGVAGDCPLLRQAQQKLLTQSPWLRETTSGIEIDLVAANNHLPHELKQKIEPDSKVITAPWPGFRKQSPYATTPTLIVVTPATNTNLPEETWLRFVKAVRSLLQDRPQMLAGLFYYDPSFPTNWMETFTTLLQLRGTPSVSVSTNVTVDLSRPFHLHNPLNWSNAVRQSLPSSLEARDALAALDRMRSELVTHLVRGQCDRLYVQLRSPSFTQPLDMLWRSLWCAPTYYAQYPSGSFGTATVTTHTTFSIAGTPFPECFFTALEILIRSPRYGFSLESLQIVAEESEHCRRMFALAKRKIPSNPDNTARALDAWMRQVFGESPWLLLLLLNIVQLDRENGVYRISSEMMLRHMATQALGRHFTSAPNDDANSEVPEGTEALPDSDANTKASEPSNRSPIDHIGSPDFGGDVWKNWYKMHCDVDGFTGGI